MEDQEPIPSRSQGPLLREPPLAVRVGYGLAGVVKVELNEDCPSCPAIRKLSAETLWRHRTGRPHPRLDGPERMLDGVEADVHSLRGLVEPLLDRLDDIFVFPARDAALLAGGAAILDRTVLAHVGPVGFQVL